MAMNGDGDGRDGGKSSTASDWRWREQEEAATFARHRWRLGGADEEGAESMG
jgi:hypothetical protein